MMKESGKMTIILSSFNPLKSGQSLLIKVGKEIIKSPYHSFNPLKSGQSLLIKGRSIKCQTSITRFNPLKSGQSLLMLSEQWL